MSILGIHSEFQWVHGATGTVGGCVCGGDDVVGEGSHWSYFCVSGWAPGGASS